MYKVRFTFSLLTILLFGLFFSSVGPAQASYYSNLITQLTSSPGEKGGVRTDGKTVVWQARANAGSQNLDVYAAKLADRQEFPVATGPTTQFNPDVDGDNIVWMAQDPNSSDSSFKVHVKSLATGKEDIIGEGGPPRISGDWVVWPTGTQGFLARNIRTMEPAISVGPSPLSPVLSFDGNRLIFLNTAIGGPSPRGWSLYSIQIGDSQQTLLESGNTSKDIGNFDLKNDLLVYSVGNDLKFINFKTGERKTVISNYQYQFSQVTTDGRYIFWLNLQPGVPGNEGILPGYQEYDLTTGVLLPFNLIFNNDPNCVILARDGKLVFKVFNQIYAAPVSSFLPTISQPPTDITQTQNYF